MGGNTNGTDGRLGDGFGLLVDRDTTVTFSFEGKSYQGLAGDTIASALAGSGQWVLSRSFKYHRPRGILTMAGQDANTLVQLSHEPNVLADRHLISENLAVRGQNYSGSLEKDRGALIERFGKFLPVGFYYKAFYRPRGAWKYWEPIVRARAGLGKVSLDAPHGYYDKAYGFYDVVVVGGGPAGMAAAIEAARAGAEVLLIEEWPVLGGSLNYARFDSDGRRAGLVGQELISAVEAETNIEVLTDATCQGWFADHWLPVIKGNRMGKVRAKRVVIASGAFEQPMVFRNNDLPGSMFGSAAQRLMRLYGVRPGRRGLIVTSNTDGYGLALDLLDAGVEVAGVVDLRDRPTDGMIMDAVRDHGVPVLAGRAIYEALGKRHVEGARIARIIGEGQCAEPDYTVECDLICVAVGYAPAAALLWHAGSTFSYDPAVAMHRVQSMPAGLLAAGSVDCAYALDAVVAEGRLAGWRAAQSLELAVSSEPKVPNDRGDRGVSHPYPIFPHPHGKDFIDFDEDLQVRDILDSIAEGYDDIQLLKRYSTVGMGPSQGRHSNLNTIRLCAKATHRSADDVGTTTTRPPYTAEKFAHLAGRGFDPVRYTPIHHRHLEAGAQMMIAGQWLRPALYGREDQRDEAIRREVIHTRNNVGLIDVSTLGGLDIRGPDAAEFIERMYTWAYRKQQVGRARYVLMCDQAGAVIDDGVACRFHENHYYVTATTGGVGRVYQQMLWWNAQWRLDVDVANVTAGFGGINIAGPNSRKVLQKICEAVDLTAEGFPYMGVRTGTVAGIPVRLLRVGFVGELGYELHAPSGQSEALWDALMEAGKEFAIKPFGVEAQRVLRLEKGHIIIGQDTDGLTHPHEVDMAWAIGRKKPFFVGKRSIEIQMSNGLKRRLAGFTVIDPQAPAPEECHLVVSGPEILGRVTSAVRSPTLDKVIGLAFLPTDRAEIGQRFDIKVAEGRLIQGEVIRVPFYDPENKRQEL